MAKEEDSAAAEAEDGPEASASGSRSGDTMEAECEDEPEGMLAPRNLNQDSVPSFVVYS